MLGGAGRFADASQSEAALLRRWVLERLVESGEFESACAPFINTEVLSHKFRLMGARIGRRVQMDYVHCVEHEHLHVSDNVVFGSNVLVETLLEDPHGKGRRRILNLVHFPIFL